MSNEAIDFGDWIRVRRDRFIKFIKNHFDDWNLSRSSLAHQISLTLILLSAVVIRLFPLLKGWDPIIKAFDPQMQVRGAKYMLENGFWKFLLWYDDLSWYPFGRAVGQSLYLAVPIAIVLVYGALTFLGFNVSVEFAAYLVPVIFGTLGVYFTYLLGKELISSRGGLFAGMIMAVIPAYVSRTIAGFVDNESLGVLFTVMAFYFFIRALNRDSNRSAFLAGISMGMLGSSWGAFRFAYDLLPIYALVIVITGSYTARFLRIYTTTVGVSAMWMLFVPRVGSRFILDMEGLAPVGMIAFLVLFGIVQDLSKTLKPEQFRRIMVVTFFGLFFLLGGFFVFSIIFGGVTVIGDKFVSVLNPTVRNGLPLIDSVSEHLPLAWGNLYSNLSTLVFFLPMGIYFAIRNPTEKNLFIIVFGLTTIYFSGSMVRLMLILAPAAAILTAMAVDNLLIPYANAAHGRIKLTKTTMSLPSIGGQNAAATYVIVFALLMWTMQVGVNTAADRFSVPELTPGSSPDDALTDWLETFDWMRDHTSYHAWTAAQNYSGLEQQGQPPVMLSWWDYGYYITSLGETVSLVDNATTNSTQIGTVGTMLMWNETAAINLMYQYNVQFVLVVPAGGRLGLGSDIGKSIWMIRIAEQYVKQYGIVEEDFFTSGVGYENRYFDSVLYRLMAAKSPDMEGAQNADTPPFVRNAEFDNIAPGIPDHTVTAESLKFFTEVFRSTGVVSSAPGDYPYIRIFRVDYPEDIELRVNEFNEKMAAAASD
ncbi:MAG: glycosyltransferase family 39 protein [Candidatus Heimdallarchaeota archaeon]|nr:glycosyltransferase family 39 protein [Candidatus Heimdallarchaeota archaeon]